jgi:hypothetical protein
MAPKTAASGWPRYTEWKGRLLRNGWEKWPVICGQVELRLARLGNCSPAPGQGTTDPSRSWMWWFWLWKRLEPATKVVSR